MLDVFFVETQQIASFVIYYFNERFLNSRDRFYLT